MNKISLLVIALLVSHFFSCSNNDGDTGPANELETILKEGTWKVTKYNENGVDRIAMFENYKFTFSSGSAVTATKDSTSPTTGFWTPSTSSGSYTLYLDFAKTPSFSRLNDTWRNTSLSASQLKFRRVLFTGLPDSLNLEKQ